MPQMISIILYSIFVWIFLSFIVETECSKILCISPGYFGHISPVVKLCDALNRHGHNVQFGSHEVYRSKEDGNRTEAILNSVGK